MPSVLWRFWLGDNTARYG